MLCACDRLLEVRVIQGLVSVIIPTYNRCVWLARAIASVGFQSYPHIELIVVDDGSTDGTEKALAASEPEVRLITQTHRGVSAARNRGIAAAQGEWLAFLDSDDEWMMDKIERQVQALQQHPDRWLCHTDEIWIRNDRRVNPGARHQKKGGWIFRDCVELCFISPSSVVIHRSLFDRVGVFDETLPACEDYDLWLRITALCPVLYLPLKLTIKYGGHSDQLSTHHWGMDRFRIVALEKIIKAGHLSAENRLAAVNVLIKKVTIFLQGARKRHNQEDIQHYETLLKHYSAFSNT